MKDEQTIRELLRGWTLDALTSLRNVKVKRIDTRRFWPLAVIFLIISVTITHEAKYAGSFEVLGLQFIGWLYAIAINLAIPVSEYFTQWKSSRLPAWIVFGLATVGSGALNIAYVEPWNIDSINTVFAWIYALLPTALIVFLGFLSSRVAKIAKTQEARWEREDESIYECFCGESFDKPIQLATHTRHHIAEVKQQPNIESGVNVLVYLKEVYPDAKKYPDMKQLNDWASKAKK